MSDTENPRNGENPEIIALRLIRDLVQSRGYPPSQREIGRACGWAGPSSAHNLLKIMEARGYISIDRGVPRGIAITPIGMKALTEEL